MSKRVLSVLVLITLFCITGRSQDQIAISGLFQRSDQSSHSGNMVITEDPGIDTLISRQIISNRKLQGMEGYRIQIYSSSDKNAREESGKVRAEFISKFPDIVSYASFEKPGYYKIRAGDFRSRVEGTKYLLMVRKVYPDAYLVPDIINFPD